MFKARYYTRCLSYIKGLHVHERLCYTQAKWLHLACLKTPPPAGAWKDIDIYITRWKSQLNLQPLYALQTFCKLNVTTFRDRETGKLGIVVYKPCEYVDIRTVRLTPEILARADQMEDCISDDSHTETYNRVISLGADPSAPFYQAVLTSLLPAPTTDFTELPLADSSHFLQK